jgi:hypothetical protein
MGKMKILDTAEAIKTKTEMLDNLLEIEVAYSLLRGGDAGEDPIDAHYKKLKCGLEVSVAMTLLVFCSQCVIFFFLGAKFTV